MGSGAKVESCPTTNKRDREQDSARWLLVSCLLSELVKLIMRAQSVVLFCLFFFLSFFGLLCHQTPHSPIGLLFRFFCFFFVVGWFGFFGLVWLGFGLVGVACQHTHTQCLFFLFAPTPFPLLVACCCVCVCVCDFALSLKGTLRISWNWMQVTPPVAGLRSGQKQAHKQESQA